MKNGRRNGSMEVTRALKERAVITALRLPAQRRWEVEESLDELGGLAMAAGATVVHRVVQERGAPTPALFLGSGKVDEIALERLGGGIGTRGPGETQLESDRRVIRRRVMQIRRELEHVRVHRRVQREGRRRAGLPVVALVGYTNAGKTTLLNRMTGAHLAAADRLFETLDPAARLVNGAGRPAFILSDTVGFIRKLPHELVAAFRATLEELAEADVLLHVVDASHPSLGEDMAAVETLLGELEVADRPTVLVLNKMDRVAEPRAVEALLASRTAVAVSGVSGAGLDRLRVVIEGMVSPLRGSLTLRIPHRDGAALALCYKRGRVLNRNDQDAHVELEVELPPAVAGTLAAYRV